MVGPPNYQEQSSPISLVWNNHCTLRRLHSTGICMVKRFFPHARHLKKTGAVRGKEVLLESHPAQWHVCWAPNLVGLVIAPNELNPMKQKLYGCFRKWWYPQIIHFNRVFHYKPSILGYPYFWKHPYIMTSNLCQGSAFFFSLKAHEDCHQSTIAIKLIPPKWNWWAWWLLKWFILIKWQKLLWTGMGPLQSIFNKQSYTTWGYMFDKQTL